MSSNPTPPEAILLRQREVATLVGVSERTVGYWRERGLLEAIRIGPGITRYRRTDVEALAQSKSPKRAKSPDAHPGSREERRDRSA